MARPLQSITPQTGGPEGPPPGLRVSFEFFPPKSDAAAAQLWRSIERLAPLQPAFMSVTYGAAGSTRERTHRTVKRIQSETGIEAAAHLTCVGASRGEIDDVARAYWDAGIRHIVALRGDAPAEAERYAPHPDGYRHAVDLVAGLKRIADFEISVACYPERHPEAPSAAFDLDNLKRKIDAGADRAITQFFFDGTTYFRFVEKARAAGIEVAIVPGILPVTNFRQIVKFAAACGTAIPKWLAFLFESLDDEADTRKLVAAMVASEQCRLLRSTGVEDFHFYTLNRAELTFAICQMLGLRGAWPVAAVGPASARSQGRR